DISDQVETAGEPKLRGQTCRCSVRGIAAPCRPQAICQTFVNERGTCQAGKSPSLEPRIRHHADLSLPPPYELTEAAAHHLVIETLTEAKALLGINVTPFPPDRSVVDRAEVEASRHLLLPIQGRDP